MCQGAHKIHDVVRDSQWYRFILAMILLIVVLYLEGVAMAFTDNRANDQGVVTNKNFYLSDLGQNIVREVFGPNFGSRVQGYNDYVTVSIVAATVIFIFICHIGQRLRLFTRYVISVTILYFIRAALIYTTVSPQAKNYMLNHGCQYYHNVFYAPIQMAFFGARTCYDTFISGHTFNVVYSGLLWSHYYLPTSSILHCSHFSGCKIFWLFFPIVVWILVVWDVAFILGLQVHYTSDVSIATVLACLIWFLSLRETKLGQGFFAWFEPINSIYRECNYNQNNSNNSPNGDNHKNNNIQYNNSTGYGTV